MKNRHFTVTTPSGSYVLIDRKISKTAYAKLFCQRLDDWFNSAEVDDLIALIALWGTCIGTYVAIGAM